MVNVLGERAAETQISDTINGRTTLLLAAAVGVVVTNLFAPQTLIGLIGPSLGLAGAEVGLVAMITLLGYAAGLFLLVPLADLRENRALIVRMLGSAAVAAGIAAIAPSATMLLATLFVLGAACSAIQVLVPIAAAMARPERRGRVIGDVMGGLMLGILLSRPLASLIASAWGWRAFYGVSAAVMAVLTVVLAVWLPRRPVSSPMTYPGLIASLWRLLRCEPQLRIRALTASLAMAAFSVFWTSVALRLAQPPFELTQRGIALFELVGAGGAVVAPLFGRAGDRGWTPRATMLCHLAMIASFGLCAWAGTAVDGASTLPLIVMGAGAVLLDIGVTGDQTLGRRIVNLLNPEARGRLNGLFVGLFFLGGAVGSALAGIAWVWGGWSTISAVGILIGLLALAVDWLAPTSPRSWS
ncbi:MFS transporter [Mesorhizobium sp.]|uniref:MFS transporter n=1 Tax=Mesorhizobium sp. TaxID=1871066 RepID=UPI0012016CFB|nr:MFS transporter [Mesorhizobium sp.]TIT02272.1 MAG: MFS transporter [Mesorhizobium sp.]